MARARATRTASFRARAACRSAIALARATEPPPRRSRRTAAARSAAPGGLAISILIASAALLGVRGAAAAGQTAPSPGNVPTAPLTTSAPPLLAQPAPPPRLVEVRLALSATAAQRLSEPRVRRLLEIELEENAVLAPGVSGPLGDHVAYVWVDEPSQAHAVIEVRVGERALSRREIRVAGLAGDVAARLVAIAASEMVRAQMQPIRPPPRRPPSPRRPTPGEIEIASRTEAALFFTPSASAAFLPAETAGLAGPSLAVGFRYFGVSEALFARWLTGAGTGGTVRWLEVGLAADYRIWLHRSWRLVLGGAATLASLRLGDANVLDGVPNERDTWSGRAGGVAGVEARLGPVAWLGLSLEPGAILRSAHYEGPAGRGAIEGLWLGMNLALQFERVHKPAIAAPGN